MKKYSTNNTFSKINPWFITGFSDAESSFVISIYRDENSKLKWRVTASFSIHIHIKDIELLEKIQIFFGVGKVRKNSHTTAIFRVDNIQELEVIISHFNKYPLISEKLSDFLIFKKCYSLILKKKHLTLDGLEQILSLRYNMNKGLKNRSEFKEAFPNIVPIDRPQYEFKGIPDPFWISGFVSGDSTFSVSIEKSTNKVGTRVRLIFGTCLHIRDNQILRGIANYFNILNEKSGGSLTSNNVTEIKDKYIFLSTNTSLLQIKNLSDIESKIIPFFNQYPILGVKRLDFEDFKKIAELVKKKEHLSEEGIRNIRKIVEGMNLDRIWNHPAAKQEIEENNN